MRTVKKLSKLTGVSVRTLHYYDEIGLLRPTEKSDAGYRLYDDSALETLQQILFFREFDLPLKEIRAVLHDPSFDRDRTLRMQRRMLTAKKERMERLIASIDEILKGENKMDFAVFSRSEIEELCQFTIDRMPDFMRESITREFGGLEQWRAHYIERASKEDMQRGYLKLVEWYGDKDRALEFMTNPPSAEVGKAFGLRIEAILDKLIAKKDCGVNSLEVKQLIGEYGFVMRQFCQVQREDGIMLSTAASYRDERFGAKLDQTYGAGAAEFFARAIEGFYAGDAGRND